MSHEHRNGWEPPVGWRNPAVAAAAIVVVINALQTVIETWVLRCT